MEYNKEFYSPRITLEREEAAYQAHKSKWDEQYKGEWIALHKGKVVAHAKNKSGVIAQLIELQKTGRFRAYIIQIGAPLICVQGPKR